MLTVVLGLSAALVYGVADFLGGLGSRRARPLVVTAVAAVVGIVPLVAVIPLLGAHFTGSAIVWGLVAGVSGSVGVLLLYSALAIGPMSVLSPLTSVFSALLPVIVAVASGARLSGIAVAAIVVAFVAIVLVASVRDTSGARLTVRGLVSAMIAGCGFGGIVLAYDAAGPHDGVAPLVVARVLQAVVMGLGVVVVAARGGQDPALPATVPGRIRADLRPLRAIALVVIVCGICDAGANALIQAALHAGSGPSTLPTVSVLNALYPIGTVVLAAVVLRERLTALQLTGLALAFAASVTLAVA